MTRWLARLWSSKSERVHRRPRAVRPQLELLEDRLAPAVFSVNSLADLSITGGVNPDGTIIGQGNTVTLRSAIQAANANSGAGGNTINLTLPGAYKITQVGTAGETDNLKGEFSIFPTSPNGNLTIVNTSGGAATVDGGGNNRVFDVNASDTNNAATNFLVTMQGFTIQNGIASPGDLAPGAGGGIRDQGNQSVTLTNMVLTNNSATADGGGIVMENTVNSSWMLTINNSTISNNHAGDAGGGIDTDGAGTVVINSGSVITGNTDLNQGAGLYVDAILVGTVDVGASLTMTGTTVSNNQALAAGTLGPPASGGSGGGISNAGNGAVTITSSTVANNFAAGTGGGFSDENAQGTLSVMNSLFVGNTANGQGGGIQEGGPSTTIINTSLRGNNSGASGGGLFANGATLTVTDSNFVNNTASAGGGGIEVETTGTGTASSTITNTTLTGNSALNNAGANGGGLDAPATTFTGGLTLLNDTINGNFATNGGGIFWGGTTGTFALQNTIVAANFAGTGPDANNPAGTFTDSGGNLIGISGAGSGNIGFTAATTQTGTVATPLDPMLGPLQNNGGPSVGLGALTLETEALLPGSPALDKGVAAGAPATDERGFARPDAGTAELPDVGAFEFQDVTLSLNVTPASPTVAVGGSDTFTIAVTNTSGNALPADNSTLTVTLSAGLTASGSLTFNVGALPAGQSKSFTVTATATATGSQTVTAVVTCPDANPNSVSNSTMIAATPALDADHHFVQALYNDFLGRNGAASELDFWVNVLHAQGQRAVANGIIHSPEALTHAVDGFYVTLLGRQAVGGEEQGWVGALEAGATEEQVSAGILSSPEFAAHANALIGGASANTNFVQALYNLLLNRTGSSAEVNSWLGALPNGRVFVALGFLGSPEYRSDVVTQFYGTLVDRPTAPAASEVAGWVNSGLDILAIEVGFASSPEYYQNG